MGNPAGDAQRPPAGVGHAARRVVRAAKAGRRSGRAGDAPVADGAGAAAQSDGRRRRRPSTKACWWRLRAGSNPCFVISTENRSCGQGLRRASGCGFARPGFQLGIPAGGQNDLDPPPAHAAAKIGDDGGIAAIEPVRDAQQGRANVAPYSGRSHSAWNNSRGSPLGIPCGDSGRCSR